VTTVIYLNPILNLQDEVESSFIFEENTFVSSMCPQIYANKIIYAKEEVVIRIESLQLELEDLEKNLNTDISEKEKNFECNLP
jgi:hypothetical protein